MSKTLSFLLLLGTFHASLVTASASDSFVWPGIPDFSQPQVCKAGGGWGSSGGELILDDSNPWWVQNTQVVHYCVQVDPESFSASEASVDAAFQEGVRNWKQMIRGAEDGPIMPRAYIITQAFVRVACDDSRVQLRIVGGWGALTEVERNFIQSKDYRRILGMAVRTDYDRVSLTGKGFIYLSSDSGPNGYLVNDETYPQAWRHRALLQHLLVHELGHVFGVPHSSDLIALFAMNPEFLQLIVHTRVVAYLRSMDALDRYVPMEGSLAPNFPMRFCFTRKSAHAFFEIPVSTKSCLILSGGPTHGGRWTIESLSGDRVGELELDANSEYASYVVVYLPPEQKVFPPPSDFLPIAYGPMLSVQQYYGRIRLSSQRTKPIYLSFLGGELTILGGEKDWMVPLFTKFSLEEPEARFRTLLKKAREPGSAQ